jgi:hypothetical protein
LRSIGTSQGAHACLPPVAALPGGVRLLPDHDMRIARGLAGGSVLVALGEIGVSMPVGPGAAPLGVSTGGVTLFDGHLPMPGSADTIRFCAADESGNPLPAPDGGFLAGPPRPSWRETLFRVRVVTNLPLLATAGDRSSGEAAARSLVDAEGGLLNLQVSRFLLSVSSGDGFDGMVRLTAGLGLHELKAPAVENGTDKEGGEGGEARFRTLSYLGAQAMLIMPLEPLTGNEGAHLAFAAEPYLRTLPRELGTGLRGSDEKGRIRGLSLRAFLLGPGGVGAGVTFRVSDPSMPRSVRWSLEAVFLR